MRSNTDGDMELQKLLTRINKYYSQTYHLRMLIFLAQAVVPYEQLQSCGDVLDVYDKMLTYLGDSESATAVSLLRYMLCVTGYDREEELKLLDDYCSEEFDLPSRFSSLPFYERLLVLSSKLLENDKFDLFWSSVNENKLNKSKLDVKSSPIDLFQSMIYERTLDADNYSTIMDEVVPLLEQCEMTNETQFLEILQSTPQTAVDHQVVNTHMYFTFEGKCPHDPNCMKSLWTSKEELKSQRCSFAAIDDKALLYDDEKDHIDERSVN